jgi:hypothetical protein
MTFPTDPIITTNLDSDSDDPSLARVDLLQAVESLNTIIDEAGTAFGVALLNSAGTIPQDQIPATLIPSTNLVLAPTTGIVLVNGKLRLQAVDKGTLVQQVDGVVGDLALCSDVDTAPVLCIFDGTDWKYLPLADMTTVVGT